MLATAFIRFEPFGARPRRCPVSILDAVIDRACRRYFNSAMRQVSSVKEINDPTKLNERHGRPKGAPGQASVEFALVLPVLLIITIAVCQVAFALNCYLVVTAASREGARRGAETNDAEASRKASSSAASALPGQKPEVDVSFPEGRSKGSPVRVTVTYRIPFLVPGLEHLLPEARFSMSTSMALERGDY